MPTRRRAIIWTNDGYFTDAYICFTRPQWVKSFSSHQLFLIIYIGCHHYFKLAYQFLRFPVKILPWTYCINLLHINLEVIFKKWMLKLLQPSLPPLWVNSRSKSSCWQGLQSHQIQLKWAMNCKTWSGEIGKYNWSWKPHLHSRAEKNKKQK